MEFDHQVKHDTKTGETTKTDVGIALDEGSDSTATDVGGSSKLLLRQAMLSPTLFK